MRLSIQMARQSRSSEEKQSLEGINRFHGVLVYPLENRPEPLSLWKILHPRTPMTWAWDGDADNRVARLWILREELSRTGRVVYTKWYKGRATFFSLEAFLHLLQALRTPEAEEGLRGEAAQIYECLLESSPQSTKTLKAATDLKGRFFESTYQRATKVLFEKGLIVAWGEVDEGAFPSLALGATKILFEDLWNQIDLSEGEKSLAWLEKNLRPPFVQYLHKLLKLKK